MVHNNQGAINIRVVVSREAEELPSSCHLCDHVAHHRVRGFRLLGRFKESLENVAVQHNTIAGFPGALQETLRQLLAVIDEAAVQDKAEQMPQIAEEAWRP